MRQILSPREKRSLAIIGGVALLGAGLLGCSEIPHQSPSVSQEGSGSTQAIAQLYREKAKAASAEADRYERRAQSLDQHTDSKGFVRSSLITAAESNRVKAENLNELAAMLEREPNMASR